MTIRIGIIAEDQSDVDVIRAVVNLYNVSRVDIEKFVGKGCGKIKGKCKSWAADLKARGCNRLILLHDSDDRRPNELVLELREALGKYPIRDNVIVIPVRELEAWLLADHIAIKAGLSLRENVRQVANPEAIRRPKEHLRDIISRASRRKVTYLNTVHNKKIASACSLQALRRCASFRPLDHFISNRIARHV